MGFFEPSVLAGGGGGRGAERYEGPPSKLCRFFSNDHEIWCRHEAFFLHNGSKNLLTSLLLCNYDAITYILCLSQFQLGTSPPGNPRGLAQKHCLGGRDLTSESCPGPGNSTRAGILWKFKMKHFVRVLVLSVINTGCPKNC